MQVKEEQISKRKECEILTDQINSLTGENKSKRIDHKHIVQVLDSLILN